MHQSGNYKVDDLFKTKEYKDLINGTNSIFSSALEDNKIPEKMMESLKGDVFLFSALKTHAQLLEASQLLLTDDNKVKPFYKFSQDVEKIKTGYNQNYLEAEYQFAVTSAQMAGKWADVVNDDYDLQYRTASDNRVRDSHAKLHDITLPASDPFWISYYPPNGWRCRCNAVQVRKGKYPVSDSEKAIAAGEVATTKIGKDGKNKLEIFRFNPGLQKVVFPPGHPYRKVVGAKAVAAKIESNSGFEINDSSIQKLKDRKIDLSDVGGGAKFFNENFKGFDILKIDEALEKIAEKNGIQLNSKKISLADGRIVLNYGGPDMVLIRTLDLQDKRKSVTHEYFELDPKLQGTGISKQIFKEFQKQYKNCDLDQIKVHANLDVGGYTWAKYGFRSTDKYKMETILYRAEKFEASGKIDTNDLKHFKALYNKFYKLKNQDAGFPMIDIANAKYGKTLLLGTDWYGKVDLKDKMQSSIYEAYLNGK